VTVINQQVGDEKLVGKEKNTLKTIYQKLFSQ